MIKEIFSEQEGELSPEQVDSLLSKLFLEYGRYMGKPAGEPKATLETRYMVHRIYEEKEELRERLPKAWVLLVPSSLEKGRFKELFDTNMAIDINSWMNRFESILRDPLMATSYA